MHRKLLRTGRVDGRAGIIQLRIRTQVPSTHNYRYGYDFWNCGISGLWLLRKSILLKEDEIVIDDHAIAEADVEREVARFFDAGESLRQQLEPSKRWLAAHSAKKEAIFEGPHDATREDEELEGGRRLADPR